MRKRGKELVLHVAHPLRFAPGNPLVLEQDLALLGRPLRRFVQAGVVDGDASLRGHANDQPLRPLREDPDLRMPEEEAADRLTGPRAHGNRKKAAHWRVPGGHAVVRRHRSIPPVLQHVVRADRRGPPERRPEQRGGAWVPKAVKSLARRTRKGVEQQRITVRIGRVVEERAKSRAAQLGGGIGHLLEQGLQVQRRGHGPP